MSEHQPNNYKNEVVLTMIEHIQQFIEQPNSVFGNMPICPFVNKFRREGKILFKVETFHYTKEFGLDSKVLDLITEFKKDNYCEVMMVIHPNKLALSLDEMKDFTQDLNDFIAPLGLIAFSGHPLDNFNIDGVYTRRDPFINFTVQEIEKVNLYADVLKSTAYYERWSLENIEYIQR